GRGFGRSAKQRFEPVAGVHELDLGERDAGGFQRLNRGVESAGMPGHRDWYVVNAALRASRRAAGAGFLNWVIDRAISDERTALCRQTDTTFPQFLRTHQRDLNFSPAQPTPSNGKAPGRKSGAAFGCGAGTPRKAMGT